MSFLKLQSSDGVIFIVDAATVKQMGTIQTMIDLEDEDSVEVIPVPTVKGKVLERVIQWTEYHKIDHDKTSKKAWHIKYFEIKLKKKFEILIAADYLEVKSLLNESCHNIFKNNKWKIIEDVACRFHDPKIHNLLQDFKNNYEHVIVSLFWTTRVDNGQLSVVYNEMKYFDPESESWSSLTFIPHDVWRYEHKLCCVEDNIYYLRRDDCEVSEYNPQSDTWRNIPSLQRDRGYGCRVCCTLEKKIFLFGGGDITCEMLDLSEDDLQWRYIASMNNVHHGDGDAVVIEKMIYVLGGGDTKVQVQVYDVDQDQWTNVTNMPTKRISPGVAALDKKIYVTGGQDGKGMTSADCYDPDTNTWSQVANMKIARKGHSLVSLHGRLYAIGGDHYVIRRNGRFYAGDYPYTIEVYDPDKDTWTLLQQKIENFLSGYEACLIKKCYLNQVSDNRKHVKKCKIM